MEFFNQAIDILKILVMALGAGLGVWGAINLLEGYGNDNPASKSQGIKQLMAGGGVVLIGLQHTELEPEGVYRYYSTQRPVDIGTYPKPPDNQPLSIVNYDDDRRRPVADGRLMAWGELTYAKPLTEKQMEDYELKPAPGNPDRVRPSITARLKDETRGQEPPKEPGQKRSHKNHEER